MGAAAVLRQAYAFDRRVCHSCQYAFLRIRMGGSNRRFTGHVGKTICLRLAVHLVDALRCDRLYVKTRGERCMLTAYFLPADRYRTPPRPKRSTLSYTTTSREPPSGAGSNSHWFIQMKVPAESTHTAAPSTFIQGFFACASSRLRRLREHMPKLHPCRTFFHPCRAVTRPLPAGYSSAKGGMVQMGPWG